MTDEAKGQVRETIGVILLAGVLVMSGMLLIKQKDAPATFTESATAGATNSTTNSGEKSLGSSSQQVSNNKVTTLVNINTASLEELDTLPGVGPATAQKILDYRNQNGSFPSKEAIDNVSGIGPSKYAQIKDLISI
jgi:comEA protein